MNQPDWNQCYKEGRTFSPVSEIVLDKLNLSGKRALDIGCGQGQLMKQLQERGFETTGIDLSDYSAGLVGDFMTHDFGDQRFDLITANLVIAFIEDKKAFYEKVKSLLNPGGKIVIITPVLFDEYKDKYTEREKKIGVSYHELVSIMPLVTIDTSYGLGYSSLTTFYSIKQ